MSSKSSTALDSAVAIGTLATESTNEDVSLTRTTLLGLLTELLDMIFGYAYPKRANLKLITKDE